MALHDKCVLMDLSITSLTSARTDRSITADVILRTRGQDDAGRWVSQLWPKAALDPIRSHDSATRKIHQRLTLPWLDNSKRILPSSKFEEYMATMRQRRPEREALVSKFIAEYDHWIAEASAMRGTAFSRSDYPDAFTAAGAFTFSVQAEPVPHRDDFRITLAGADLDEIHSGLEARLDAAARIARNELLGRVCQPLVKMVERLSDPDAKFRDSLIENVRAIAAEIPDFNLTDDPEVEALRQRILRDLGMLQPDALRESKSDRSRAARKAGDILATMAPWLEDDDSDEADAA